MAIQLILYINIKTLMVMSKTRLIDISGKRRGSDAYESYIKELKNPFKKDDERYYDFIIELNEHRKWIALNKVKANGRKQDDQCKYILGGILFSYLNGEENDLGKGVYPFEELTKYQKGFLEENYPTVYKNLKYQIRSLKTLVSPLGSGNSKNINDNKIKKDNIVVNTYKYNKQKEMNNNANITTENIEEKQVNVEEVESECSMETEGDSA